MEEIWKEVPGTDGKYFLVGYSKVYSKHKNRFLKECDNKGYLNIAVSINGKCIYRCIHFWVAYTCVPIPERLSMYSPFDLVVHHKDFNPNNNDPSNLEWLTAEEHRELHAQDRRKPVFQYGMDGKFIAAYRSVSEAAKVLGTNTTQIFNCCNGKYKTAYGYQWKYELYDSIPPMKTVGERLTEMQTNGKKSKKVAQYTLDGKLVKIWPSSMEIVRQLGYSQGNISMCCIGKRPTAYGFIWKYA